MGKINIIIQTDDNTTVSQLTSTPNTKLEMTTSRKLKGDEPQKMMETIINHSKKQKLSFRQMELELANKNKRIKELEEEVDQKEREKEESSECLANSPSREFPNEIQNWEFRALLDHGKKKCKDALPHCNKLIPVDPSDSRGESAARPIAIPGLTESPHQLDSKGFCE